MLSRGAGGLGGGGGGGDRDKGGYAPVAAADSGSSGYYNDQDKEARPAVHDDDGDERTTASATTIMTAGGGGSGDDDAQETTGFLASGQQQSEDGQNGYPYQRPERDNARQLGLSAWLEPSSRWSKSSSSSPPRRLLRIVVFSFVACLAVCVGFKFVTDNTSRWSLALPLGAGHRDSNSCPCSTASVPQHFQTSPQLFAGPTQTGHAAFLAATVTIDPSATFVANQPLQTNIAVDGMPAGESIFQHMGYLSPYNPSPGFGVQEYALPPGAEIVQLQMLSRHGSRYPTLGANVKTLGDKLAKAKGSFTATGVLSFLGDWEYKMGHEILVPKGRQELFDSGVLHSYMYSQLYNPNSKIIVRTTTQDRMLKSAENFLAGFFGLEWTNNATIEVLIEGPGFNNSLAGYLNCPNSNQDTSGTEASTIWEQNYLRNATARFQQMVQGIDWTLQDTYAAQTMCPYETAAFGFSQFCDLFTYEEWLAFGYSIDLNFAGNSGFQSSTGRAVGIGYQQEVIARLKNHTLGYSGSQINVTLDNNTDTFPLNQSLYLDFSHDTNIVSILTAFGLQQFAALLQPARYPGQHNFTVAHIVPFGARLDIEIIRTPHPIAPDRSTSSFGAAVETKYVHFVLNQRTIPLGASFPECDASRVDGWCELDTFLRVQEDMPRRAKYDEACFGPFTPRPYGMIMDGAPM